MSDGHRPGVGFDSRVVSQTDKTVTVTAPSEALEYLGVDKTFHFYAVPIGKPQTGGDPPDKK